MALFPSSLTLRSRPPPPPHQPPILRHPAHTPPTPPPPPPPSLLITYCPFFLVIPALLVSRKTRAVVNVTFALIFSGDFAAFNYSPPRYIYPACSDTSAGEYVLWEKKTIVAVSIASVHSSKRVDCLGVFFHSLPNVKRLFHFHLRAVLYLIRSCA